MKKKFIISMIVVLVLAIALTALLIACTPAGGGGLNAQEEQNNIFALVAISAGELISGSESDTQTASLAGGDTASIAAELDQYMAMLDSIIGGSTPITSTVGANTNAEYAQYETVQTVTTTSVGGVSETYTIYYNETYQPEYGDDDDWGESEENYRVEGVMLNGENVFEVSGWRTLETEGRETEESLEFTARNAANGMFMVFELENENEGNETGREFAYTIYQNNRRVRSFEIGFEKESGWTGDETEFELFTHENGQSMEYEIESVPRGGVEIIRITRRVGGPVERYYATRNADGTYAYEFAGTGDRW